MMRHFLLLIILTVSCNSKPEYLISDEEKEIIKTQVSLIRSNDDLTLFLKSIYTLDQEVRTESSKNLQEHGPESKEYDNSQKRSLKADLVNLERVKLIIERFGYPKKDSVGRDAAKTPLLIILQSSDETVRKEYFPILYQAYLDEDVDDDLFSSYLEKAYRVQFNKRFDMPLGTSFQLTEQIDTLIQILNWPTE